MAELGAGGVALWLDYIPEYEGNRNAPEGEQLRVRIKRITTAEKLVAEDTPGALVAWRDAALGAYIDGEWGDYIKKFSPPVLLLMRQFVSNTKDFENFCFDGEEQADPVEVFMRLPISDDLEDSLLMEIILAIKQASALTGAELKNLSRAFVGHPSATGTRL